MDMYGAPSFSSAGSAASRRLRPAAYRLLLNSALTAASSLLSRSPSARIAESRSGCRESSRLASLHSSSGLSSCAACAARSTTAPSALLRIAVSSEVSLSRVSRQDLRSA